MTALLSTMTNSQAKERKINSNTLTGLKRWSCQSKELPPVSKIQALHVYDFDNTLFRSPLPNPKLWNSYSASRLQNQDVFSGGGWWHDKRILEATGGGIEVEEQRAWAGWWNEQIVSFSGPLVILRLKPEEAELVRLSAEQKDVMTILLTGRAERNFSHLIKQMVASKSLYFDIICLKPEVGPKNQRFPSTMLYKQAFLHDLVYTYHEAEEIKIYEDRPKQTKAFRDFFQNLNQIIFPETGREYMKADVIQVADQVTYLDPVIEASEIQRMANDHNAQLSPFARPLGLKRVVLLTGYLISPADTAKLLNLVKIPPSLTESEIKYLANSIMIAPRPADPHLLDKVGGLGHKQTWQVTGSAFYQSSIWAVRVTPVPPVSALHTLNATPLIVLATYKNTKPEAANNIQTWQQIPADKQYILQTEVGEKVQLRIEAELDEGEHDSNLDRRNLKRKHSPTQGIFRNAFVNEENRRVNGFNAAGRNGNQTRNKGGGSGTGSGRAGTGPSTNNRGVRPSGPGHGGGRSARQRGPKGGYKSLDDIGADIGRYASQRGEPNYDDYVPEKGGYDAAFPALKESGVDSTSSLPYGK